MVMGALRDKIKIVIMITLLAFVGLIFFEWGMQQSGGGGSGPLGPVIAKVNGIDVPYEAYRQTRAAIAQNFEQRTGRAPEDVDQDSIEDETWLTLVQDALLQQKIEEYGITLSDAEIVEIVRRTPPDVLRNHPDFQNTDGQFDFMKYQAALNDPSYEPLWVQLETYMRAAMPSDKLQTYLSLNARVTSAEVRERFVSQNERVEVSYVPATPAMQTVDETSIPEADLRAHYEENRADFEVGEQAVLEFVRISKEPTPEDSAATRADLEDIRRGVVEGADFEAEARTWSDDPSAERGGDLGFFARGDMPQPIEEAAFSLDAGQISEVFESPFGYHIVRVEERKNDDGEETVRARHILLRVEASNQTLRHAASSSDDFADALADGDKFDAIAAELDLTVERTTPFERGALIPGVGYLRAAQRFAFHEKVGTVTSEPLEDDRAYYLFRVAERQGARTVPFEEVQDRIRANVAQERQRELAREKLAAAVAAADGSLASIAAELGTVVETTGEFTRDSFVPGVGRKNAFVAAAFAYPVGRRSDIVESDRGFYVLEVMGRIAADDSLFAQQEASIRSQLLLEKRQNLITAWIDQMMLEADVVDYRSGKGIPWHPEVDQMTYGAGTGV